MSVVSKAQKLQVNAAQILDDLLIHLAGFVAVRFLSVRYKSMVFADIYMVEQICIHKVTVALVIFRA